MALYEVEKDSSGTPTGTKLVAGGTLYADSPIGTILPYGGASAPSGWFLCQGQALSRTTYSELFAIIGTSFGVGDGSTTFNLPDMRESVPKGAGLTDHTVGNHLDADGLAVGEFLDDRLQDHNHTLAVQTSSGGSNTTLKSEANNYSTDTTGSVSSSYRKGATTEVKSVGVNYIIKAKMVAVPSDFMSAVDEAVEEAMGHSKVTIPFSSFVNPESHVNSEYSQLVWHKFSNYGVLHFAILVDGGVTVDTRCMITENVKSLLGITNAWGREEVGVGGITSNDNTSVTAAQATVELRTGNDDDLRFRINSSNGGWIRGQLFLSKS